jgi:hypothetical protein
MTHHHMPRYFSLLKNNPKNLIKLPYVMSHFSIKK